VRAWVAAWGPAAAWAAFLFFLSSREMLPVDLSGGLDKVSHFGAYAILGFLLAHGATRVKLPLLVAVLAGWVYGVLDELHQSTVPGRSAEVLDWVADALGTVAGVLLFLAFVRLRRPLLRLLARRTAEPEST
jgi:VanZ family protein